MMTFPAPLDLSYHWSYSARNRQESAIKDFYKYFRIPGIANIAGGLPNAGYFPFDTLEADIADPHRFVPSSPTDAATAPNSHITVPHSTAAPVLSEIDLKTALQYGTAQGYPPLFVFLRHFTRTYLHPSVPYAGGPEIILTCGNTDGFSKSLSLLTNEWAEGVDDVSLREGMLCEEFAYMQAIQAAAPRGLNIVPVKIDEVGMIAEGEGGLRDVLTNWDMGRGKRPHLMYTVTIGQNPTTTVLPVSRRRELYRICCEFDIIIVEDDPYWYMQYPSSVPEDLHWDYFPNTPTAIAAAKQNAPSRIPTIAKPLTLEELPIPTSTGSAFMDSLTPSYLSIDYQGRVIRLDTFSKTVAPGCRLGWITTQPAFVERLQRITETSTQQPSGFVQSLIAEMLAGMKGDAKVDGKQTDSLADGASGAAHEQSGVKRQHPKSQTNKAWGHEGFIRWLEGLRGDYERRMNAMADVLEEGKYATSCAPLLASGRPATMKSAPNGAAPEPADAFQMVKKEPLLFDFVRPRGGMFVWMRLNFESHPLFSASATADSDWREGFPSTSPTEFISHGSALNSGTKLSGPTLAKALWVFLTRKPYLVLAAPGGIFSPTEDIAEKDGWRFFRLSFSAVEEGELGSISERFISGVRAFWDIREAGDVRRIIEGEKGKEAQTCCIM